MEGLNLKTFGPNSSLDAVYLRIDASNDPVTGDLTLADDISLYFGTDNDVGIKLDTGLGVGTLSRTWNTSGSPPNSYPQIGMFGDYITFTRSSGTTYVGHANVSFLTMNSGTSGDVRINYDFVSVAMNDCASNFNGDYRDYDLTGSFQAIARNVRGFRQELSASYDLSSNSGQSDVFSMELRTTAGAAAAGSNRANYAGLFYQNTLSRDWNDVFGIQNPVSFGNVSDIAGSIYGYFQQIGFTFGTTAIAGSIYGNFIQLGTNDGIDSVSGSLYGSYMRLGGDLAGSATTLVVTNDVIGYYADFNIDSGSSIGGNVYGLFADFTDADISTVTGEVAAVGSTLSAAATANYGNRTTVSNATDNYGYYADVTVGTGTNARSFYAENGLAEFTDSLTVSGTTTLDTSLTGLLLGTSGVVSAISADTYVNAALVNGTFKETFNALVTSDGVTVTMSIEQSGGGDLSMQFSDGVTTLDCTPAATTTLTAGSDTSPTENYVYVLQSTKAITVSTSDWPATEHIKIAYFLVPSASFVQTSGCYINQNWNDHLSGTDNMGHLPHMAERSRRLGAIYATGIDGNGTDGYLTPTASNVELKSTAGVIFQMHKQTVPAFDTSTGDEVLVKNWSGTPYNAITNLFDITADSTGTTITNNKYFNLVIWAVSNKSGEYTPWVINLPSGFYNTQSDAENDVSGYDDFTIPAAFRVESSTGFLIARITIQMGTTWVVTLTSDLRGTTPATAAGGVAGTVVEFPDNTFRIFDETDVTKLAAFDVGTNISTGTTRTFQFPDNDGLLATEPDALDWTGAHTWSEYGRFGPVATHISPSSTTDILHAVKQDSSTSGVRRGITAVSEYTGTGSRGGATYALNAFAYTASSATGNMTNSTFPGGLVGNRSAARHHGSGTITLGGGMACGVEYNGAIAVTAFTTAYCLVTEGVSAGAGNIGTAYGIYCEDDSGVISTSYGLYMEERTAATNNFEIFLEGSGGIFFRDSDLSIASDADGRLDIDADTAVDVNSDLEVQAGNFSVDQDKLINLEGTSGDTYIKYNSTDNVIQFYVDNVLAMELDGS